MRAARIYADEGLRVEDVPDPEILEPTDAILRVTDSAVCGSDLHVYHGRIPGIEDGTIPGHEFAGVVEAVGPAVRDVEVGERYVASMFSACGHCPACLRGETRGCRYFGMFGFGMAFGDLAGGQAELVRVPFADSTLSPVPAGVETAELLLLSDILPTAYSALARGKAAPGETIGVVGAGPVGQLIAMCAPLFGVARVIVIDLSDERLEEVQALGAATVNPTTSDPLDAVLDLTNNQGADLMIEAAGNEEALGTALQGARVGGRVVLVGVLVDEPWPMDAGEVFIRGLEVTAVLGEPLKHREALTKLVLGGRLRPSRLISHEMSLEEAPKAYELFEAKEAMKVVLRIGDRT